MAERFGVYGLHVLSQTLASVIHSPLPHISSSGSFTELIERIIMSLHGSYTALTLHVTSQMKPWKNNFRKL